MKRRDFIKTGLTAGLSLSLTSWPELIKTEPLIYKPRTRIPNPYIDYSGKPILVCVEGNNFNWMLKAGLRVLGGLNKLIAYNQNVLIKPNLVFREHYPTTSDPESIIEMIWALKRITGNIYVGDQGGENSEAIYPYLNLENAVMGSGANLVHFSETYLVNRHTNQSLTVPCQVYSAVYDAPTIINFCCLKRHLGANFTCAIKNNLGALSGPAATDARGYIHTAENCSKLFLKRIAEAAGLINPELNIVDARNIMIKNGPLLQYGGEIKKEVNKLIICGDMVATDAYCAKIMEENDETFSAKSIVPTLKRAEQIGLGTADLSQVRIIKLVQKNI